MAGKYLKIDHDLTVYYEESGHGDVPVLLVPGWTMSTQVFERQLEYFSTSRDYRFVTFDPRSHGLSSNTDSGHFYQQHGKDLHGFIEALNLDNLVLGGWSFGTLATLSYVNQFGSDRLSGFIMLDGPPKSTGADNNCDWVTYRYDDNDHSQEFFTMGKLVNKEETNREFAIWMLENKSEKNIQWIIEITNQSPDTAAALLNATSNFLDYRDDLISLHDELPLLYVVRSSQETIVKNWSKAFTPDATVRAFGEHMMFWERSEEFNKVLMHYLTQKI